MKMTSPVPRGIAKPIVAFAALFALFLAVQVASASAASITIEPKKVKTSELTPPNYKTIGVAGTGFATYSGNPNVRVGLCTKANIGVPAVAPGCGLADKTFVIFEEWLFGAVKLVPTAEKTAVFANEHFGQIPGQPETFDCSGTACRIVVVEHKKEGTSIIASADITFE